MDTEKMLPPFCCCCLLRLLISIAALLCCPFQIDGSNSSSARSEMSFSSSPSELPVRRVNLLGNQIFVRQMFVDPLRPAAVQSEKEAKNEWKRAVASRNPIGGCELAKRRQRKQASCGGGCGCGTANCNGLACGGAAGNCGGGNSAACSSLSQPGLPPPQYQVVPAALEPQRAPQLPTQKYQPSLYQPAAPTVPNQSSKPAWQKLTEPNPAFDASHYSSSETDLVGLDFADQKTQNDQRPLASTAHQRPTYQLPFYARPPPANYPIGPPPPPRPIPPQPSFYPTKPKYPLPECYKDSSNFMCCNAQLEETLGKAYDSLFSGNKEFHRCNVQKIANQVQQMAEERFNTSFEAVVGLADFASKSHFFHNYICKIERDNRFIMAYATPRWDLEGQGRGEEEQEPQPLSASMSVRQPSGSQQGRVGRVWNNHFYQWR